MGLVLPGALQLRNLLQLQPPATCLLLPSRPVVGSVGDGCTTGHLMTHQPKGKEMTRRLIASLAAAGALVLGAPAAAFADSVYVSGELNRSGSLVQYSTYRTHTFTGPINMNLTNNTANYTRLGLRDTSGNQFTNTSQWNAPGSQNFVLPSGSTTISSGKQFAFNGRMGACTLCDNVWGGTLNY